MNKHRLACDDQLLIPMLRDALSEAEADALLEHVETCRQCQRRISELAATNEEWDKVAIALTEDLVATGAGPQRKIGLDRPIAWTESMARQLLSPPSHPENLGRLGRYEVERLVGAGGMGVVFRAFDSELNRPVAIKVLAPHLSCSGPARRRFEREARAAAAVVHHHVVPIHNVETEGDSPFLVMHYVAGESLQARIDREGPLDLRETLRIGMQVAAGLSAAHSQGLVHRDIKPSNILLEEEGIERALITDFGLARAANDASLTQSGCHPGTPQYMSPEQARGDSIDQLSDLFSLGSLLYTLCTGLPPFRADTSLGVMRRISDDTPTPIREINSETPEWLSEIVNKLMSKSKTDRFESADEVHQLLEACLNHVQQPTAVELPRNLKEMAPKCASDSLRKHWFNRLIVATVIGSLALLASAIAYFVQMENEGATDRVSNDSQHAGGDAQSEESRMGHLEVEHQQAKHTASNQENVDEVANGWVVRPMFTVPTPDGIDFEDADIQVSDDQSLVLVGKNGEQLITIDDEWRTATTERISGWRGMQFVPGTRRIVTKTWDEVILRDPGQPHVDGPMIPHKMVEGDWINPIVSPDGTILVTRPKLDHVQLWDLGTLVPIAVPIAQGGHVSRMHFTTDSKYLCTYTGHGLSLWNPRTGEHIVGPFPDGRYPHGLMGETAYDPVEERVATIENGPHAVPGDLKSRVVVHSIHGDQSKKQSFEVPAVSLRVLWADPSQLIVWGARKEHPDDVEGYLYDTYPLFLIRLDDDMSELLEISTHVYHYPQLTPDGQFLIAATKEETLCWKVGDVESAWRTPGRAKVIRATDDWVLLHGFDGTTRVHSVANGDLLLTREDIVATQLHGNRIWLFDNEEIEVLTLTADVDVKNPDGAEPLGHGYARLGEHIYFAGQRIDTSSADDQERLVWELGRELPALDTFGSENRKESFLDSTGWVLKGIKLAADIDAESFVPLSTEYSKDKNKAYYRCHLRDQFWMVELPDADLDTLEYLGPDLAKDNFQLWQKATPNLRVDTRKVRVLGAGMWTDSRKVWSTESLYVQAYVNDPGTFEHIAGKYFRDAKHAYYRGSNYAKPIEGADPATFRTVGDHNLFAVDQNSVWLEGTALERIDVGTFEVVHEYICKDKDGVYIRGIPISAAFPGRIRKVADLDDRGSVLLSDNERRFVYLADWIDVFQVSLNGDSLEVCHEIEEGAGETRSEAGQIVSQLTAEGWTANPIDSMSLHSHHERLILEHATPQFLKAWEFMSGRAKSLPDSAIPTRRVVDLATREDSIRYIYWSSDGTRLATVSHDEQIRVFGANDGTLHSITDTRPTYLPIVRLSGNLSIAAIVDMGHHESASGAVIHSVPDGEIVRLFDPSSENFPREVEQVAFGPDGERVAVADRAREKVTIWNVKTGEFLKELPPTFYYGVNRLAWSNDGKLLLVGTDGSGGEAASSGKVYVCRTADNVNDTIHETLREGVYARQPKYGEWLSICGVSFSDDGKHVIATYAVDSYPLTPSDERFVHVWNIETGASITGGSNVRRIPVGKSELVAREKFYVMHQGRRARVFDRVTMEELMILSAPNDIATHKVAPDNDRIAIATKQGEVRIYDLTEPAVEASSGSGPAVDRIDS